MFLLRCTAESKDTFDIFHFGIGNRLVEKGEQNPFILETVRRHRAKGEPLMYRTAILTSSDSIKIASGSLRNSPSAFLVN